MRHLGTQVLSTERLLLRPLSLDDAQMMFCNWAGDPAVTPFLRWQTHRSWAETAEYLNELAKHYSEPDFYEWGIVEKGTGILLGSIGLPRAEADDGWTFSTETLGPVYEAGYVLGQKWWNQGFATEALCAVRDYWFSTVQGQWLACCHANENVASGAVMQKAGFVYDHDAVYHKFDGSAVPCRVYCIRCNGCG